MTHLQNFQRYLNNHAALISSPQNQFYLSGFSFSDGYLVIFSDRAYLLTDFRYAEAAKKMTENFCVLCPQCAMFTAVKELLEEQGVKELLVEENDLTVAEEAVLRQALGDITVGSGVGKTLSLLRVCKDEEELTAIKKAQSITDAAFAHILNFIHPDMTEIDVALELEFFMRRAGSSGVAFETIAVSGSASSQPHGVPRNKKLERGFLTMDFGARYRGYCADMTRTIVIGHANADMKKLYNTVIHAQKEALDRAAFGVSCALLDGVAREIIDKAGYEGCFGHSLGHGVGIDIHEAPRLSRRAAPEEVLQKGHVVTVEPGIYLEEKYGCRIEDMIVVHADGSVENLTQSSKALIEI